MRLPATKGLLSMHRAPRSCPDCLTRWFNPASWPRTQRLCSQLHWLNASAMQSSSAPAAEHVSRDGTTVAWRDRVPRLGLSPGHVVPGPVVVALAISSAAAAGSTAAGRSSSDHPSGSSTPPGSSQMMAVPSGRVRNPT